MAEIKSKYFYSVSPKEKKQLQSEYERFIKLKTDVVSDRVKQLLSYHPFSSDKPAEFFDKYEMFGMNEGFDIVIGNPPYVRQERIKYKDFLTNYSLFTSTADLYTYFFELAFMNLKPNGVLSFITSSKYGRALYGEGLRRLLATEKEINHIVDYGDQHVFSAITNTWVIQLTSKKPKSDHKFKLLKSIEAPPILVPQEQLSGEAWAFNDTATEVLKNKIKAIGPIIGDTNYKIYRGLLTGINEVFLVNEETKNMLIQLDPKNAEILNPILRGRDIGRFELKKITNWLITTKNDFNVANLYPTIAKYLEKKDKELEGRVQSRGDKGVHWMNLRDCAYYDEMELNKIVWLELSDKNKFAYSENSEYLLNGAWMMVGPNLKEMLGIMNSSVVRFYFNFIANSSGMGTMQWRKHAVENIPIPDFAQVLSPVRNKLIKLVEKRLKLNITEHMAEALNLEKEIDRVVYAIYSLGPEDIELIESEQ
jgi:hypothetical protein